jgi:hypothetical protein
MVYRLILDENVEHEVLHRLENYGHDVEHIDFSTELRKGTATDRSLGTLKRRTESSSPTTTISLSNSMMPTIGRRSTSPTRPCRLSRSRT